MKQFCNEYNGFDRWLPRFLTAIALVVLLVGAIAATSAAPMIEPTGRVVIDPVDVGQYVGPLELAVDDLTDEVKKLRNEAAADRQSLSLLVERITRLESRGKPDESLPDPGEEPTPAAGFTVIVPRPGDRVYHVDPAGGDNANPGTRERPLATVRAALDRVRDGSGDQVLVRAGSVLSESVWLNRSGESAERPLVLGVYGAGPRPRFEVAGGTWIHSDFRTDTRFVLIQGWEGVAIHRDPLRPGFDGQTLGGDWRLGGIGFLGNDAGIRIEDCKLSYFATAMVFQSNSEPSHGWMTEVTLHRNIIVGSYNHHDQQFGGHSQGIYAEYVKHLTLSENVFDHNGWQDSVAGAQRTKFNHNIYIQSNCADVVVRGNVIARGSSHGLQLRPGGVVEENLFVGNALALLLSGGDNVARGNVILQSDDIGEDAWDWRGSGIGVDPCRSAVIEGNILSQKVGRADNMAAIDAEWKAWITDEPYRLSVKGNRIFRWRYRPAKPQHLWDQTMAASSSIAINRAAELIEFDGNATNDSGWADPERDVAMYAASVGVGSTAEEWLKAAGDRPRLSWPAELSAAGVIGYVRGGFETR